MTSQEYHKHVLDGQEKFFKADTCPICNPQQATQQRERPPAELYIKGKTLVVKVSKAQLMTIHHWETGNAFLYSHKRMARDHRGQRLLDRDGQPIWESQTFRLNIPQTRQLVTLLQELLTMTEGDKGVPTRQ